MVKIMIKKIVNKIVRKTIGQKFKIGSFNIKLGRDHNLLSVLAVYPKYGSNLVNLARVVSNKYTSLKIIDIGANVGDTVASLLNDNPNYKILSIEGDESYLKILHENFGSNPSVKIFENFLGSKNETIRTSIQRKNGTLKIGKINNNEEGLVTIITLDSLIENNHECKNAKLLKIDTDGYDNKILRGAVKYLSETKPVVFFEYDSKLLKENNEIGVDIFDTLEDVGYKTLVFFDNYGRFLVSVDIREKRIINQLHRYINNTTSAFPYYDIAVFHNNDNDIAQIFIKIEEES